MAGRGEVLIRILGDATGLNAVLKEGEVRLATFGKAVEAQGSAFDKFAGAGKAALIGLGAVAGIAAVEAVKLADTYEKAHAQLETAITNSGHSFDEFGSKVAALDKHFEHFGYTNAQTEQALARLTFITHNPTTALNDLAVAADIARARNIDLTEAANLLGKGLGGNYTALVRLGVITKDQVKDLHNANDVLRLLAATYGGAAAQQAGTFAGKMAELRAKADDLGKNLGVILIPIIEKVAAVTGDAARFFTDHKAAAEALAVVVGGVLATAMTVYTVKALGALAADVGKGFTAIWTAAAGAVVPVDALTVSLEGETVAAEGAGAATLGFLGPLGLVAIGTAGAAIGISKLEESWSHLKTRTADVEQGLIDLANAGAPTGAALDVIGVSSKRLIQDLDRYKASFWESPGATKNRLQAIAEIDQIDKALAHLVTSGHADTAAKALAGILAALPPDEAEKLRKHLNDYNDALAKNALAAKEAAAAGVDLANADGVTESAAQKLEAATLKVAEANVANENAAVRVTDATKALALAHDAGAQKARDLAAAENGLAQAGVTLVDAQQTEHDAQRKLNDLKGDTHALNEELLRDELAVQKANESHRQSLLDQHAAQEKVNILKAHGAAPASLKLQEAQLKLDEANTKVSESTLTQEDATTKLAKARAGDTQYAKDLTAAETGLRDAKQRVADANQAIISAQEKVNTVMRQDPIAELAKAQAAYDTAVVDSTKAVDTLNTALDTLSKFSDQGGKLGTFGTLNNIFAGLFGIPPGGAPATVTPPSSHRGGVQMFDRGGTVRGVPGQAVPAIVHGGEEVLTPAQMSAMRAEQRGAHRPTVVNYNTFEVNAIGTPEQIANAIMREAMARLN